MSEPITSTIMEMDDIARAVRLDSTLFRPPELCAPSSPGVPSSFSAPSVSVTTFPVALPKATPIESGNPALSPFVPKQAALKRHRKLNQANNPWLLTSALTQQNLPGWPDGPPGTFEELCKESSEQRVPIKYEPLPVAIPLDPMLEPDTACSNSLVGPLLPNALKVGQIRGMDHDIESSTPCHEFGDVHTTCSNQVGRGASLASSGMLRCGSKVESPDTVSKIYGVGIELYGRDIRGIGCKNWA